MYRKALAAAFVVCAVLVVGLSGLANAISHSLVDARFRLFPRDATSTIALVAIDAKSIDEVGVWPWPRTVHAELLEKLEAAGVADIVFDVDFSARSSEAADAAFAAALRKAQGSVVLPSFVQKSEGGARFERLPLARFREHAWLATANVAPEPDGLIRRYSFGGEVGGSFEPAIGAMLAGRHEPDAGDFFIDFSIRPESIPTYSLVDVLSGKIAKSELAGRKIAIGATAIELGDRFTVPNGKIIPGPTLQVLSAETLLQDRALYWTRPTVTALGIVAIGVIALFALRNFRLHSRLLLLIGMGLAVEALATFCQVHLRVLVDTSLWHAFLAACLMVSILEELDFRSLMARLADARFRHVARAVGEGLICTDARGQIQFWNPGASRIFNIAGEDARGGSIQDLLADQSRASLDKVFEQGLPLGSNCVLELIGKRSGEEFALEAGISTWGNEEKVQFAFVLRDISERKQEQDRIRYLAEHDPMTGLANRSKLCEELTELTRGENASPLQVILLGMDGLKALNDLLGQDRGDRVLVEIASRLQMIWAGCGKVARVSGDEFSVIVLPSTAPCDDISNRIEASLAFTVPIGDRSVPVTLSAGSAFSPADGTTADLLLANAALALGEAKTDGVGRHVPYVAALREGIEQRRSLEAELKIAYEKGEFELFYQPQVLLESGRVVGAEALLRWRHPMRGLTSPAQFIPVLETSAVACGVGRWVLVEAVKQAARWHESGHDLRIGINLSQSMLDERLPALVSATLADHGCPSRLIELEVTETIALDDNDYAARLLRDIQAGGVDIAFDDFGTGFASLTSLRRFPLNRLKIDQTFVREMLISQDDHSIVSAIVTLGRLLGLHLIAEGVEDANTAAALKALGCEEAQGYYFGRPVPADEFVDRYLAPAAAASEGEAPCAAA